LAGAVPSDRDAEDLIDSLRHQLRVKEREIGDLRAGLREAQMTGIAVGVLLARTPGWTEQDALAAWDRACARLTRGGNTKALVSYVVQTGRLPGEGIPAKV
jgi:tetrahydromethanopterin S-methyltransferase subunit F